MKALNFAGLILVLFIYGCAHLKTTTNMGPQLAKDLKAGNFVRAAKLVDEYRDKEAYLEKDRVLYYLDKGAILHYMGDIKNSNKLFEEADRAMEDLFTRSVTKAAASMLLNDNVLDYRGEVYENIYVNLFKCLNYLRLNQFDDAYVEIKRVNDKLRLMDDKYGEWVEALNAADTSEVKLESSSLDFYDDVFAHYLSYIIFKAEGEQDNARISFEKMQKAWNEYPAVYNHSIPGQLRNQPTKNAYALNVVAFTGSAPQKEAIGGQITTYDDYIHVSDLTYFKENHVIHFPGVKNGLHFKFAFPDLRQSKSIISKIEVKVDGNSIGDLALLEDMGNVALKTFEQSRSIIYLKTVIRTVLKGLASEKAKKKIQKKANAKDNFLLGAIINIGVDAAVDATENPDLRNWKTMPRKVFVGEFPLTPGQHDVTINFYSTNGLLVKQDKYEKILIDSRLNLVESVCLN